MSEVTGKKITAGHYSLVVEGINVATARKTDNYGWYVTFLNKGHNTSKLFKSLRDVKKHVGRIF